VPPDDLDKRLADLRSSSDRFLAALAGARLTEEDVRQPSLLPGWSRAHVLTHFARNADGIAATLHGAVLGEPRAMYPGGQAGRDADIEAGASRSADELVEDVAAAAAALDRAWSDMTPQAWDVDALTRRGPVPAWRTIGMRWREVEIHWVDLDIGYGPADWPAVFVDSQLPPLADPERLAPRLPDGVAVDVVATDTGRRWSAGDEARRSTVAGPSWALLCWLVGRPGPVRAELGAPPPLAPWS
jgi:maleylpyruvate isomerase